MTRRCFGALLPGAALAAAGASPIGTVVAGNGHGHAASKLRALQSMPEFRVAGLSKPDAPVSAQAPAVSFDEALRDPAIELILCEAADADENLRNARAAVDAGKYVHLDKPPGSDWKSLETLLRTAQAKGRVVQMGYQWRYQPAMQAAIHAAHQGWLGRVYRFRASIDKLIGAEERRHLANYRGGMMFSEGCHLVDRATATLGKPGRVSGFLHHHGTIDDGLADDCLMILEYRGALAEISLAGFDARGTEHRVLEIQGTNGIARVQPYTATKLYVELQDAAGPYAAGPQTVDTPPPAGLAYTPDFRELAAVIRHGAPPAYTAEHDLMTHRVLLEGCGML